MSEQALKAPMVADAPALLDSQQWLKVIGERLLGERMVSPAVYAVPPNSLEVPPALVEQQLGTICGRFLLNSPVVPGEVIVPKSINVTARGMLSPRKLNPPLDRDIADTFNEYDWRHRVGIILHYGDAKTRLFSKEVTINSSSQSAGKMPLFSGSLNTIKGDPIERPKMEVARSESEVIAFLGLVERCYINRRH